MIYRLCSLLILALICSQATARRLDSVTLRTNTGTVYGTLTVPAKPGGKTPVVIIIPGSGPTDRDGNSGEATNNSLRMLSDSLIRYGISSLRFDKRGIAASKAATDESKLLFSDYIDDVEGWIRLLRKDKRFNRIFIAGHSEGSLIGMLAARRTPVAGYISIAGAGLPADSIILQQLANAQAPPPLQDSTRMLFAQLRKEGRTDSIPGPFFQSIFRPSIQRYLHSWIQFDPAREISLLKTPTLIVQGSNDIQVDTAQAHILSAARPDAELIIIPDMNHVLKEVKGDDRPLNISTYYDPSLPLKPELVQALVRFIRQQGRR